MFACLRCCCCLCFCFCFAVVPYLFSIEFKLILRNILTLAASDAESFCSGCFCSSVFSPLFSWPFAHIHIHVHVCVRDGLRSPPLLMHSPNPLQPRFKANPQLLVRDQGLAVLLLLVLVQLLQEYSWIGLTLVGLLLQHCPVVDVVILMVQRPEQYAEQLT